jgi:hypothetical protein
VQEHLLIDQLLNFELMLMMKDYRELYVLIVSLEKQEEDRE